MKQLYVGIDPGLDGAVAVIDGDGKLVSVDDSPSFTIENGKKKRRFPDALGMSYIMRKIMEGNDKYPSLIMVGLEDVHSMPKQGVASSFLFGRCLGTWVGIVTGNTLPLLYVSPQRWKKEILSGMGKDKDASRMFASQLYPNARLNLKKHHNRADAILIAYWLMKQDKS